MQTQQITITLPAQIMKQLRSSIPQGKRSRFVANLVSQRLQKKKDAQKQLEESLKANYEFYKKEAKIWKVTEVEGWPE